MRCLWVFLLSWPAAASTILFSTAPGSVNPFDGQPVAAQALFSTGPGAIAVTLENLLANPASVSQNVAGLMFMLAGGSPEGASLSGSEGAWIRVAKDGAVRDLGTGTTGWTLRPSGGVLELCALCASTWPAGTLIGPPDGLYGAANRSIAGSGSHNPFLRGPLQFQITAPGATSATGVRDVAFSFGTTPGTGVTGVTATPESSSAALASLGGLGLLWLLSSKYARQVGADLDVRGVARHRGGSDFPAAAPEPKDAAGGVAQDGGASGVRR